MKKSLVLLMVLIIIFTTAFTGCAKSTTETNTNTTESEPGENTDPVSTEPVKSEIVIVEGMETTNLDPAQGVLGISSSVKTALYDSLVVYDEAYNIQPRLAESWEESEDHLSYTFKLREDAFFHDGEQVTSDDVLFSYEQQLIGPMGAGFPAFISKVEVIDKFTVKVSRAMAHMKTLDALVINLPIMPKHLVEANPTALVENPIGSGPYIFSSKENDGSIVLTANPKFYLGEPVVKKIIVRSPMEMSSAVIALENETVDIVKGLVATQYNQVEQSPNLKLLIESSWSSTLLFLSGEPFKSNVKLREAVFHAINVPDLILLSGVDGKASNSFFAERVMGDYYSTVDLSNNYDLDLAKSLLIESQYDINQPIVFSVLPTLAPIVEVIQAQLNEIGLKVEIEQIDMNVFYDKLMKQELTVMVTPMGSSIAGLVDLMNVLSTNGDYYNSFGEKTAEYDAKMSEILTSMDSVKQKALIEEALIMQSSLYNLIPLFESSSATAYNNRIQNMHGSATGIIYFEKLQLTK